MRKTGRSVLIAFALAAGTLGTISLLAPTVSADSPQRMYCGGEPGGLPCPEGFVCYFVPRKCNPLHGGADCLGYCRKLRL